MKTEFRDNLRVVIESSGFLVKELASLAEVDKRTIDKWVSKTKPVAPNVCDAVSVAIALGTTVEYLVDGEEGNKHVRSVVEKEGGLFKPSLKQYPSQE